MHARAIVALSISLAASANAACAESINERIAAAAPGSTVEIAAGTYREHVRIDKPLRLIGVGRPVIDGGGNGDIVEIIAPDVELRGFALRDTGIDLDKENCAIRVLAPRARIEDNVLDDILFGIDLKAAPDGVIRGNRIGGKRLDVARRGDGLRLWRSDRTLVENNDIHDGRDAILWYSTGVTVRGNRSSRCRYGFHLMYSNEVTLEANELRDNSVGVYFMYSSELALRRNRIVQNRGPSGYGVGLKEADRYVIEDNLFLGNRAGVYIDGSPFTAAKPGIFRHNTFAYNDVGVTLLPAVRGNRFVENNFVDNLEQVSILGRGELSGNAFAHDDRGNFWSDYVGYDADRDGIGDYEHSAERLFEQLLDREPKLRVFLLSPAQQAIDFVARALPAMRPEPKFTDPAPLVAPVECAAIAAHDAPSRRGLVFVATALLACAAGLVGAAIAGAGLARSRVRGSAISGGLP
ncbi:MAG: nitrous oxide reductase family maturation protein NosD [Phycisphaerales bacterium]